MNNREIIQKKAQEVVGHCLCSKAFTCPCKWFQDMDQCKCAMEGNIDVKKWVDYNTNN